jgi:16S rRNA (adenine1518-N6/adenine1519-N6)-dimethyltransferase
VKGRPHRAKKSLGQNFLVDAALQRRIVDAVDPAPGDTVVEIGPGRGALTRHLVGRVADLRLVELDDDLAAALASGYGGRDDVTVIHGDILEHPLGEIVDDPARAKVVGNIPYNITTPILFHLLARPRPARIVMMVQKEVARRIVAEPGGEYGALAVGVQAVADARLLFTVKRGAFRPVPRVDSAVVEIVPHAPPRLSADEEVRLRDLTRTLYQWRRKQLGKILRDHPESPLAPEAVEEVLAAVGIDPRRRPETVDAATLLELARRLP